MTENTDSAELFPIDLDDDINLSSNFFACLDSAANFATQDLTSTEIEVFNKLVNPDILMDQPALNVEQNVTGQQPNSSSLLGKKFIGQQLSSSSLPSNKLTGQKLNPFALPNNNFTGKQQNQFSLSSNNFIPQQPNSSLLPSNDFNGQQQGSSFSLNNIYNSTQPSLPSFPSNKFIAQQQGSDYFQSSNYIYQQQSSFASSRTATISKTAGGKTLSVQRKSTMVQKYNIVPGNSQGRPENSKLPKIAHSNGSFAQNYLMNTAENIDFLNQKTGYDETLSVQKKTTMVKKLSIMPRNSHRKSGEVMPSQTAQQTFAMDKQLEIHPENLNSEYGDLIPFHLAQHNDVSVSQEQSDGNLSVAPANSTIEQMNSEIKAVTIRKRGRKRESKFVDYQSFRFENIFSNY